MNFIDIGFLKIKFKETDWLDFFENFFPTEILPFLGINFYTRDFLPIFETKYWCPWFLNKKNYEVLEDMTEKDVIWGYTKEGYRFIIRISDNTLVINQNIKNPSSFESVRFFIGIISEYTSIIEEDIIVEGHATEINSHCGNEKNVLDKFIIEKNSSYKKEDVSFFVAKRQLTFDDNEKFLLRIAGNYKILTHENSFKCKGQNNCEGIAILGSLTKNKIDYLTLDPICDNLEGHKEDERVWYPGIARHCPQRPTEVPIKNIRDEEIDPLHYILFPKESPRLYFSGDDFYIGLKENKVAPPRRLENKTFPAFPCCYKTKQYERQEMYIDYLRCNTDDEFKMLFKKYSERGSSKKGIILPGQVGYISNYHPFENILKDTTKYLRTRLSDWKQLLKDEEIKFNDEVMRKCYKEFYRLGFVDFSNSLFEYFLSTSTPDIRFFYPFIERIFDTELMILVRKKSVMYEFLPVIKKSYKKNVSIVIKHYDGEDNVGYELITDLRDNFIIGRDEII